MSFVADTLVVLRESLEALLILGVLIGLVTKLGHPRARGPVLLGAAAGVGLSVLLGAFVIAGVQNLGKTAEEAIEGLGALLAAGILTYMVVWMVGHTQGLLGRIQAKARAALDRGENSALFGLAFVAVAREGFETVIFIGTDVTGGALAKLGAVLLGVGIAVALGLLVYTGVLRLNLRRFFATTGALLVVFAAGLLMTGLHELMEIGWIPATPVLWDLAAVSPVLDHHQGAAAFLNALTGYRASPRLLELGAWAAYLAVMGGGYLRPRVRKVPERVPAPGEAAA